MSEKADKKTGRFDEGQTSAPMSSPHSEQEILVKIRRLLVRPGWTLFGLLLTATSIEFAQYLPEIFPGGHAVGEIIRNLTYALIAAVIFHWIVVEYPDARRRRNAYGYHALDLQLLACSGLALLYETQHIAKRLGLDAAIDIWDDRAVQRLCRNVWQLAPSVYRQERYKLVRSALLGTTTALEGLNRGGYFFDADVAQAVAHFPGTSGLQQLQLLTADEPNQAHRDGHIVWELLVGGRRIYNSLRACAPHVNLKIEQFHYTAGDGTSMFCKPEHLLHKSHP